VKIGQRWAAGADRQAVRRLRRGQADHHQARRQAPAPGGNVCGQRGRREPALVSRRLSGNPGAVQTARRTGTELAVAEGPARGRRPTGGIMRWAVYRHANLPLVNVW